MPRRSLLLTIGGALVLLAVIGAVYLEIAVQAKATHTAWTVTQDIVAGTALDSSNVRQVKLADTGDPVQYFKGDPIRDHRRAASRLSASHLLSDDDLMPTQSVLVPLTFKSAPSMQRGDKIDVYVLMGTKTIQVGRGLVVEQPNPTTVWVPPGDEAAWVTLQANNSALFAVRSSGVGVPSGAGLALNEAASQLAGSASEGGSVPGPAASPPAAPSPSVQRP
ncbi:MAG: hypothetical protein JF888_03020 [Candidatus Dormibacteraeota bacterium]|uniref:SAF domain-containing protein n=1 Tax=Candidatus Dormiibacter inghamiae TaxID=3127013 RepID=A0A934K809_9BACT|nr:hypothetical protein [Candidatus Dormibacteraeota bacterium]MBJ7605604.1 hypothetical protein [Candidatus Dormibacteraeota bacterium]